jgi:hypothetical protein
MSIISSPELVKVTACCCRHLHCMWYRLRQGARGCPHTVDISFLKQYVATGHVLQKAATVPGVSKSSTLFCILDQRTLTM